MDARSVLRGLLDLVAPPRCPGCDRRIDQDDEDERDALEAEARDPHATAFCWACAPLLEPSPVADALYAYGGPLADAIKRLKYEGRLDVLPGLSALMQSGYARVVGEVDMVVPVPLHPARRVARGFDQAALLVQPLAKSLGLPMRRRALVRVRDTPAQARLDAAGRDQNMRGAFRGAPLRGERVLLFDDVRTTGATLSAATEALYDAGAGNVVALCLAVRV